MTMKSDLMAGLLKGWVTPMIAFNNYNCLSLSQRCGEFRRERENDDWNAAHFGVHGKPRPPLIIDKWVNLPNGKRVKAYRAIK